MPLSALEWGLVWKVILFTEDVRKDTLDETLPRISMYIGAGSVVTHDIPADTVAVGTHAR